MRGSIDTGGHRVGGIGAFPLPVIAKVQGAMIDATAFDVDQGRAIHAGDDVHSAAG